MFGNVVKCFFRCRNVMINVVSRLTRGDCEDGDCISFYIWWRLQLYFEIICIIFSAISKCDFSCAHYVYVLDAFIMWEKHIWMHACVLKASVNHFLYQLEVILYDVSFFIFGFLMIQDLFSFFFTMIQNIYFRFLHCYKIFIFGFH